MILPRSYMRLFLLKGRGTAVFLFLLLFVMIMGSVAQAAEVRLQWTSLAGNGARVSAYTENSATFLLPRQERNPSQKAEEEAFAYLLSQSVALPADWSVIRLSGRWWLDPGEDPDAADLHMAIGVFGRYPALPHGLEGHGIHLRRFLQIAHSAVAMGPVIAEAGDGRIRRQKAQTLLTAPMAPRPFILEVRRSGRHTVSWILHERVDGQWKAVAHGKGLRLFSRAGKAAVIIRIGAWGASAGATARKAFFDRLKLRVLSASPTHDRPRTRKQRLVRPQYTIKGGAGVVRMSENLRVCLKYIALPPGATNAAVVPVRPGMSIRNTGSYGVQNFLVRMREDALKNWFLRHPPEGPGWIVEIKDGRIIWWRGNTYINIQYSRTGVTNYSSFLLYCEEGEWRPCRPRFLRALPVEVDELLPAQAMELGLDINIDWLRRLTGLGKEKIPIVGYFRVKMNVKGLTAYLTGHTTAGIVPLRKGEGEGLSFRWKTEDDKKLDTLHLMRLPNGETLAIAACWVPLQ